MMIGTNVGKCSELCLAGICSVDNPPIEGRGTNNVIYVYERQNDTVTTTTHDDDVYRVYYTNYCNYFKFECCCVLIISLDCVE